jgi:hypothetical protein
MKINVHGGTARSDEPSLCLTCRYASIVQGATASQRGQIGFVRSKDLPLVERFVTDDE